MLKSLRTALISLLVIFTAAALIPILSYCESKSSDFPTDLLLDQRDLPGGFALKDYVTVDVPGATKALAISFVVPNGSTFPPIRVTHKLALYTNEQSAQSAYQDWEKELFPVDDWKVPADFHFKPADSMDLYRFGCMPGYFNGQDLTECTHIQQHGNMISEILANLDGKTLKLADVEKMLANLDARLSQK